MMEIYNLYHTLTLNFLTAQIIKNTINDTIVTRQTNPPIADPISTVRLSLVTGVSETVTLGIHCNDPLLGVVSVIIIQMCRTLLLSLLYLLVSHIHKHKSHYCL